jgi:hypothetical protein
VLYRRSTPGEDPWVTEKVWVFAAGAVAAMVGMLMDSVWVMAGAGVLLAAGVLLRFIPRGSGTAGDEGSPRDPGDPFDHPPEDEE